MRPIYEGVPEPAHIRALGFEPSGVFPNNEGHFPWLLELDTISWPAATCRHRRAVGTETSHHCAGGRATPIKVAPSPIPVRSGELSPLLSARLHLR